MKMKRVNAELNKIVNIPQEEWDYFISLTSVKLIPKHEYFIRAGEAADSIGFCLRGLLRLYYTTPEGAEFNKSFCTKHDFVTSYSALLENKPSYFSIQALVDSELVMIKYRDFQLLYERHVCWERLGRIVAEKLFLQKETREREFLMFTAEERYHLYLQRYGNLSEQIPLYHAASYLGITPVALSRIRKKINLG